MNSIHNKTKPASILLIEDNPGDIRLIEESLKACSFPVELYTAEDGTDAIEFLHKKNYHVDAPTPDLILLDLNLPKMDGYRVLQFIKIDNALKRIPVVVLTSSESDNDIGKCYDLHANCYISKPSDIDNFDRIIQSIVNFWFSTVTLPHEE